MSLSTVIAAINQVLTDPDLGYQIAGLTTHVGAEYRHAEEDCPRVVWVPHQDTFEGAELHGEEANGPAGFDPKAVRTRVAQCNVYLWAADLDGVDALVNNVVAATHVLCCGAYEALGGAYVPMDGNELSQRGRLYVLRLQFRIPVVLPAPGTGLISTITQDLGMTFPDGQTVHGIPSP